jgi:hypothetical protein
MMMVCNNVSGFLYFVHCPKTPTLFGSSYHLKTEIEPVLETWYFLVIYNCKRRAKKPSDTET